MSAGQQGQSMIVLDKTDDEDEESEREYQASHNRRKRKRKVTFSSPSPPPSNTAVKNKGTINGKSSGKNTKNTGKSKASSAKLNGNGSPKKYKGVISSTSPKQDKQTVLSLSYFKPRPMNTKTTNTPISSKEGDSEIVEGQDDIESISDDDISVDSIQTSPSKSSFSHPSHNLKLNTYQQPWYQLYAPKSSAELYLHPKKINELRTLLNSSSNNNNSRSVNTKIIVISGPPGCGKSIALSLLATESDINIIEFDAASTRYDSSSSNSVSSSSYESLAHQFDRFLNVGKNYSSLFDTDKSKSNNTINNTHRHPRVQQQMLLLDEMPSQASLPAFRNSLKCMLYSATLSYPLALVLTETDDINTSVQTLLGKDLMASPYLKHVSFNAVAQTYIEKALLRISELAKVPINPDMINIISRESNGDIRLAVNSLEMYASSLQRHSKTFKANKRKRNAAPIQLNEAEKDFLRMSGGRDEGLDFFHAIGKVIYYNSNKNKEKSEKFGIAKTANEVLDFLSFDPSKLIHGLHENYLRDCASLDVVNLIASNFSDADRIAGKLEYSSSSKISDLVALNGVLSYLPAPNTQAAGFRPFNYPYSMRVTQIQQRMKRAMITFGESDVLLNLPYRAVIDRDSKLNGLVFMDRLPGDDAESNNGIKSYINKDAFQKKQKIAPDEVEEEQNDEDVKLFLSDDDVELSDD